MFRIFGVVAVIAAILSLSVLGWHGLGLNLGPSFNWLLTTYEEQASRFFRLFEEPLVRPLLHLLSDWTGVSLTLHPHWKHVVVLLWLNIGAELRNAWRMGNKGYSVFAGVTGIVISLITGLASGVFGIDSVWSNVFVALFPMIGYLVWASGALGYHATNTLGHYGRHLPQQTSRIYWWRSFRSGVKYSLLRFGFGVLVIAAGSAWSLYTGDMVTGLAMLGVWILFFALYWLITGALSARAAGQSVFDDADFQHGWIMLTTIAGAVGLLSLAVAGV